MRRGFAAWLASKLSVLMFATAVFAVFAYYFGFVQDFQKKDEFAKTADNIARFVETVGSAPYALTAQMSVEGVSRMSQGNTNNELVIEMQGTNLVGHKKLSVTLNSFSLPNPTKISVERTSQSTVTITRA